MTTFAEKMDDIYGKYGFGDIQAMLINKALQELQQAIKQLPTHVGDTSAGIDLEDVLELIGEPKE